MTDSILTFTLCVCLAWLGVAVATHTAPESEGLKILRGRLQQAAVLSLLAFTAIFSSWYYLGVSFLKPAACDFVDASKVPGGAPPQPAQPEPRDPGAGEPGPGPHQPTHRERQAQLTHTKIRLPR